MELRALYTCNRDYRRAMKHWIDAEGSHYSPRLEIPWPQHPAAVSAPARDDAAAAGLRAAAQRVHAAAWAIR